jgi:MerR family transcriptional regulator, light-induced transcriptional regulator
MAETARSRYATEPMYNIKAVVQKTGIPADTVRAWERRYGVPLPKRTETGRRLYSDYDVASIRWLRERTIAGMTISQAIQQLRLLGDEAFAETPPERDRGPRNPAILAEELLAALLAFDEQRASAIVSEAFALYRIEEVCLDLFSPVVAGIDEQWRQQEATITQRHFASHFLQHHLTTLRQTYTSAVARGTIVTACAPDEGHELGALILAIFLVRRAWRVIHLGANVPIADLVQTVSSLQPALVCLSASNPHTAQTLIAAGIAIAQLPGLRPLVTFDGAPFNTDEALRAQVPGHYLGADAQASADRVEELIAS